MTQTLLRRLAASVVVAIGLLIGGFSATASAHNSLLSSDPADGAALTTAPSQIVWNFDKSVPLESMTVTLIDATGARTEIPGSFHGVAGDSQVVTPLPALSGGDVSVRWRLVGTDGHPITGRVDFSVVDPNSAGTTAPTVAPDSAAPESAVPLPAADDESPAAASSVMRWLLRYASYAAIMSALGILLTSSLVWPGAGDHPALRRILSTSLLVTAVLGLAQLMVVAADISGAIGWSMFSRLGDATTLDIGMALALRVMLALTLWFVVVRAGIVNSDVYTTAVSVAGVALLGTWAFAGHAGSQRWPAVGVINSIAHHGAAAAWIAGLAIVMGICLRASAPVDLADVLRRFSGVAARCVAVLVVTGIVQMVRLVGSPLALLDARHGRLLAVKLVVVGAMLLLAAANRRHLGELVREHSAHGNSTNRLRRAVAVEFALGVAVVAVTAALVVSAPATSADLSAATNLAHPTPTLHRAAVNPERTP